MNFLKENATKNRLRLRLEAYQNVKELEIVNDYLTQKLFILPELDLEYVDLESFKMSNSLRLGNQLEYFFEYFLSLNESFKVLKKNIQIVDNKITIGELDFLVEHIETKQKIHIETATKFYLFDEEEQEWIGPNRNDSLLKKLTKLKEKQFPLLYKNQTNDLLKNDGFNSSEFLQKIHFKSLLFIPFAMKKSLFDSSLFQNIEGVFYLLKEFEILQNDNYKYFIPEKHDWLIKPEECEVWFDFEVILQSILFHFQNNKNPLVWIKKNNKDFERAFVVDW